MAAGDAARAVTQVELPGNFAERSRLTGSGKGGDSLIHFAVDRLREDAPSLYGGPLGQLLR